MFYELPRPSLSLVIVTQCLLGALGLVCILGIAALPGLSASIAEGFPEYAVLRIPLLALAIGILLLAILALAMVALLVHSIHRGRVLNRTSLLWVDGIVTLLSCAVVLVVVGIVVIDRGQAGSPGLALALVTACLGLVVLACITLVLRSLLRQAISMRAELDEVV